MKLGLIIIWGVVIILAVLGVVILAVLKKPAEVEKSTNNSSQIPAPSQMENLQDKQNFHIPQTQNNSLKNLAPGVRAINLQPVADKQKKATAVMIQDKKSFVLVVEAELSDPGAGENYSVWLTKKGTGENLLLGQLGKKGDKYGLSSTYEGNLSDFQNLLITKETKDDNTPEKRIFESNVQT